MEKKDMMIQPVSECDPEDWMVKQIKQALSDVKAGKPGIEHAEVFRALRERLQHNVADKRS